MLYRDRRTAKLLHRELSHLIQNELRDPRLASWISITRVELSSDLKMATAYFSILGKGQGEKDEKREKKNCIAGLKSSIGYIKRRISQSLSLKYIPEIRFREDRSISEIDRLVYQWKQVYSSDYPNGDPKDSAIDLKIKENE